MPLVVGIPASGGPEPAARRFRLASPVTATALGAAALVMLATVMALSALLHQLSVLGSGPIIPIGVVYAAVGFVVVRRQPGNPIGWILITFIQRPIWEARLARCHGGCSLVSSCVVHTAPLKGQKGYDCLCAQTAPSWQAITRYAIQYSTVMAQCAALPPDVV